MAARRAELIATTLPGAMLAVSGSSTVLSGLVTGIGHPDLVVAADDGPALSIASGPRAAGREFLSDQWDCRA